MEDTGIFHTEDGFLFPFKPYDVQLGFMKSLYTVLEKGGIGIFESPTGTGKSLSIICGSLKWLKDEQKNKLDNLKEILQREKMVDSNDWFASFAEVKKNSEERLAAKQELDFIESRELKISKLKKAAAETHKQNSSNSSFVTHPHKKIKHDSYDYLDSDCRDDEMLIEDGSEETLDGNEEEKPEVIKIFYASRTHSQLLQFMNEFKKTPYNSNVTITCLASRTNLCVNKNVTSLKSHRLINERCTELLNNSSKKDAKSKKSCKCPFYNQSNIKLLQNKILVDPLDIEDLADISKELHACPYYATRHSVSDVEMVLVPYNILLHKSTRESCGVNLKGNVVIIDEAHNLLEAINNMYSSEVSGHILQESQNQLSRYHSKYKTRLSPKSIRCINMLLQVLKAFIKYLSSENSAINKSETDVKIIPIFNFLCDTKVDNMNFFDLVKFCDESHIGNKLHGFASKCNANPEIVLPNTPSISLLSLIKKPKLPGDVTKQPTQNSWPSAFNSFIEFLKALTLPSSCGKIVCTKLSTFESSYFKLLHLNPSLHFSDIVSDARAVILAGGTMNPISDFIEQLCIPAGASQDKIFHYTFGHVVANENIKVLAVQSGIKNVTLDFTFQGRQKSNIIAEFSQSLLQICKEIPGGIVCFFPSYGYEQVVHSFLEERKIVFSIEKYKTIFREPKNSSQTEELLVEYARAIKNKKGALLFSVVGGKMSEGINFSDDLCRCVIMVGLPYAKKDAECLEKLSYIKHTFNSSDDHYRIMCMKAVNQSIGRAIRHKNDYAVILLLDHRYTHNNVLQYLPTWLSTRIFKPTCFNETICEIQNFFEKKLH